MSAIGLPVSRLVNVDVVLTPTPAQAPNLNSCLIVGSSNVIDVTERIRAYADIAEVAGDFGTSAPEYLAAALFFGQSPQPDLLYIGRWAEAATSGILYCGTLNATEQTLATWTAITAGNFKVVINASAATNIVCGSFAAAGNLNAVAAIMQTAVRAVATGGFTLATVVWDGSRFIITSGTTGAGSTVGALTAGTANDISVMMKGTAATLSSIVNGIAVESPVQAVTILDNNRIYWYLMTFASTTITDIQTEAVAGYIQAANNKHIFGVSSTEAGIIDPASTTDIAYVLQQLEYNRTFVQYSANPYSAASYLGRAVTVNFAGNSTVITMMYKAEPGIIAENLTTSQANAAQDKNANVYAEYNNQTAIIQYGTVASGHYFDEIQDTDWLALAIQTAIFNLLYTSTTKIPQTDAGNHLLYNAIEGACAQAVANGTLAPGVWNANGFGQLKQGDFIPKGYYIYQPPTYLQSVQDRAARKSVLFQVAGKLAGAIHTSDVILNINQ
jgi:hypothetical protein